MSITSETYQIQLNDTSRDHSSPTYLDNLVLTTVTKPSPGYNEVLVRIHAAALNFRDLLVLVSSPLYIADTAPGLVPCADGAGEIEATGPQSEWADRIGEAVLLVTNNGWIDGDDSSQYTIRGTLGAGDTDGTLRQYAIVKDHMLVERPKNLNFEEAAAMVAAGGTAMHALNTVKIGRDSTVLTQGTGGVSCFVIQFAAALGARVIATSSSDNKLQTAKALGATDLINYCSTPNWGEEVLKITDRKGVDLVADVGGAGTLEQSLIAVRDGGSVAMIGFLTPKKLTDIVSTVIFGGKIVKGIRGNSKIHLKEAAKLIERYDVHPLIGKIYEWKDAPKAFENLREGGFVGKIVIKV